MQLKNRTIDGVPVKGQMFTNVRGECSTCGVRGNGISISLKQPERGVRFVCYSCLIKLLVGDIISAHKEVVDTGNDTAKKVVRKRKTNVDKR